MYVFQLFDYYSGSRIILFVAAFSCVAVAWIYGKSFTGTELLYSLTLFGTIAIILLTVSTQSSAWKCKKFVPSNSPWNIFFFSC